MTIAFKPAHPHNYRSSAYERKANDFYPTPSDLVGGLPLGLAKLGLELPRFALVPCGGDGALSRGLAPFGVDVRLSDLYPERHPEAAGYITRQPLDASEADHLKRALESAGAGCTAIISNTPHNTDEACAIVRNLVALVEEQQVELPPLCSGRSGALSQDDWPISTDPPFSAKSFVVGALGGSQGVKEARCTLTRGTSGGRSHGAARR
jgi:hypothetical protein